MMQFGGIKLKIEPPAKFSGGTKDNYEDFEKRLRTYLSLSDTRFPQILKWVVKRGTPITEDVLNTHLTTENIGEYQKVIIMKQMNPFLYYTLVSLIEGSAYTILEQVDEECGFEEDRKLYARFAKTKMQNAIMRMAAIINMKFNDNANFETTFSDWEYEIHRFNESVDTKLQDEVKVGILIAGTTS